MNLSKQLLTLMLVISCFGITSCKMKSDINESKNLVKTATVQKENSVSTVSYPGKIIAASDVNLSFRIAGPIAKVNVVQGQKVRKGDVLAEIEERDYKLQLSATEAEYRQIKAEAERVIELYKRGSATQNDHDKAFYGLQQITAKYTAHKNALADTKMHAPFDGYIQKIFYDASETIGAGMPVLSMISSAAPEVEINISSRDYVRRSDFKETYCTIDVFPGEKFSAQYIDVTKKANLNQLYAARFLIKPSNNHIPAPGMSANVYITIKSDDSEALSVPVTSIFEKEGNSCVWVVGKDLKLSLRKITAGEFKKDGRVIISQGLYDGETVVIAGVKSLKEGITVKIKEPASESNIGNIL